MAVYQSLTTRVKYIKLRRRKLKGGRQAISFLKKEWEFKVARQDITTLETSLKENQELQQKVHTLSEELSTVENLLQRVQQGKKNVRGMRRSSAEYSDRHIRRLKRRCVSMCNASLSWMEDEGLKPLQVVTMNTSRNETQNSDTVSTSRNFG